MTGCLNGFPCRTSTTCDAASRWRHASRTGHSAVPWHRKTAPPFSGYAEATRITPSRTSGRRTRQSSGRSSESCPLDVSEDQSVARPSGCPLAVRWTRSSARCARGRPADGNDPQRLPAQVDARRGRDLGGTARTGPLTVLVELRSMGGAVE